MKRAFRWGIAIVAVIGIACASGGGGTDMPVAEARELLMAYAGQWELDPSSAPTQRARIGPPPPITVEGSNRAAARAQVQREVEAAQRLMSIQLETFRIFNFYPRRLVLQVEGDSLVYRPTLGASSMLPLDGRSIARSGLERDISTRITWDIRRLEVTHQVENTGRVSEVLELVGDRLRVTRAVRVRGQQASPFVLVYDRQQVQEPEDESAGAGVEAGQEVAGVEAGQEVRDEDEDQELDRFRLFTNCREVVPAVILKPGFAAHPGPDGIRARGGRRHQTEIASNSDPARARLWTRWTPPASVRHRGGHRLVVHRAGGDDEGGGRPGSRPPGPCDDLEDCPARSPFRGQELPGVEPRLGAPGLHGRVPPRERKCLPAYGQIE